jgi:hypothetical protein
METEATPQKAPAVSPRESATEVLPAVPAPRAKPGGMTISVAGHPRAARMVRRSREAAGLAGFLVAGWLSLPTSSIAETLLRALVAGAVCQLIVWGAAVLLCKQLITAELRDREQALMRAAARAREEGVAPNPALAAGTPVPGAQA